MIPLDSWALRQRTGLESLRPTKPAAESDEITGLIVDLQGNLLAASRFAQGKIMKAEQAKDFDTLAKQLAKTQGESLVHLKADLDRQLAALFLPLLDERLQAKAISDFCQSLGRAIEKDSNRQLLISAPAELQAQIAQHLDDADLEINFENNGTGEISASCAGTEIVAELQKWKIELHKELST